MAMVHSGAIRRLPVRQLVLGLFAALFAISFGTLADLAEDQRLLVADSATRTRIQAERRPSLEGFARQVTRMGSGGVLAPLNLLVLVAFWPRFRRLGVFIPLVSVGALIVEGIAKWTTARPRPNLGHYGFPSGHTLAAVAFFGALVYALWCVGCRGGWFWTGAVGAALVVLGVGASRLYLDVHWLSDVLGGLAGGLAVLLVGIIIFEATARSDDIHGPQPARRSEGRHA